MRKIIHTENAPAPIGPYSQAVMAGNMLFVSGQIALDPKTGHLQNASVKKEAEQVMENLRNILEAADMNFDHVVKTSIFLSNMEHFTTVNEVYQQHFNSNYPARETMAVKGLPKDVHVEISMIAVK